MLVLLLPLLFNIYITTLISITIIIVIVSSLKVFQYNSIHSRSHSCSAKSSVERTKCVLSPQQTLTRLKWGPLNQPLYWSLEVLLKRCVVNVLAFTLKVSLWLVLPAILRQLCPLPTCTHTTTLIKTTRSVWAYSHSVFNALTLLWFSS